MKNSILLVCLFVGAAIILAPIDISILKRSDQAVKMQTSALLAKVGALDASTIQKITITQDDLSTKKFQTEITAQNDIQNVTALLSHADTTLNDGHNTPIYNCTLTFTTSTGTVRFLASARQYDPNDCYLTDLFYTNISDTSYIRGNPPTIRVPGLGGWLMQREPNGKE